MPLRKLLRSLQVFFPFLQNARFTLERSRQKAGMSMFEPDFNALKLFEWGATPLFLDIGANRGMATQAMQILVPEARVIAFEPNPILYPQLQRLYGDKARVTLSKIALGEASLDAALWVPVYRNWIFDGLGSLDQEKAAAWLNADRLYFFDCRHLQLRRYDCHIRRLDEFDLTPDFIKIDVQGHELEVLHGAAATLQRCHPLLLIENPEDEQETAFLETLGYTICAFENGQLIPGKAGKVNSFFLAERQLRYCIASNI